MLDIDHRNPLFEAQQYENMFKSFLDHADASGQLYVFAPKVKECIQWAKTHLKKNDRIVWYLRLARYALSIDSGIPEAQALQNYNKQAKTNLTRYDLISYDTRLRQRNTLDRKLEHYLSMNVPAIDNFVFSNQSPNEVLNKFEEFEQKHIGTADDDIGAEEMYRNKRLIKRNSDDDVIIKFPDGYAWVDLNTPASNEEGAAMGHCGNRGSYKNDETILSLRKSVTFRGEQWWYPVCTFILDGNGFLGEMKGRGNDKPQDRYHKYIIALLKNSRIHGIKGGGYMPKNNFSLDDLSDSQKDALIQAKPVLGGLLYIYRDQGMSKQTLDLLYHTLKSNSFDTNHVSYKKDKNSFVVYEWRSFEDFIQDIYDETVKELLKIACGEGDIEDIIDFAYFVDKLPEDIKQKFIENAGMGNAEPNIANIKQATKILINANDKLYQIWQDTVLQKANLIRERAWKRICEYVKVGWSFECGGSLNIPGTDEAIIEFIKSQQPVELIINENSMVEIASADDEDYDYNVYVIKANGWSEIGESNWEWIHERRKEEDLLDDEGEDSFLDSLTGEDEMFINPFLDKIKYGGGSYIEDPRQEKLLESIQRMKKLAGIV